MFYALVSIICKLLKFAVCWIYKIVLVLAQSCNHQHADRNLFSVPLNVVAELLVFSTVVVDLVYGTFFYVYFYRS